MKRRINYPVIGSLTILMALSVGCGSSEKLPKLVPVEGTVKLDGQPVKGVSVFFNPMRDTLGVGAYAVTDENGKFKLMHYSKKGRPGCEEGSFGVTFSKRTQPDGSPIPAGKTPAGVATVEQIPKVYTKFDPSNVASIAVVKDNSPTLDFDLQSNRRTIAAGGAMGSGGGMPVGGPAAMYNGRR